MSETPSGTPNESMSDQPAIILVRPQMGENIGAAARAMFNFELTDLRLVAPRDGWPNDKAMAMASGADGVIEAARLFDDTPAALADLSRIYATTARRRDMTKPVMTPRQAAVDAREAMARGNRVGFMFGGERAGLDNEDTVRAHVVVQAPTNPKFASLNLAQAVLLLSYEWFMAGSVPAANPGREPAAAKAADLEFFLTRLEGLLDQAGFLRPPEKAPAMKRNIRNIFLRLDPNDQDLRSLQGIISALQDLPPRR